MASRFRSHILIFSIAMGVFASLISTSMLTIAFPDIAREYVISFATLQWRNVLFFTMFACGLPFFGKMSDRFGTRRQFLFGLFFFSIVTLVSAFLKNWYGFLLFQSLQGIADAMIVAVTNTLIRSTMPDHKLGWAYSWFSAVLTASTLIGPSLGGLILTYANWHAIFWVLCLLAAAAWVLAYFVIPATQPTRSGQKIPLLSPLSILLAVLAVQVLFFDSLDLRAKQVDALVLAASLLLLLYSEKRRDGAGALFPRGASKNVIFATASVRSFLLFLQINAIGLYMPSFLRNVQVIAPNRVGMIMLLSPAVGLCMVGFAAKLSDSRPRLALGSGIAVSIAGTLLFTMTKLTTPLWYFMLISLLFGFGVRMATPAQNRIAILSVPRDQTGSYMGLFQMIQFISGAFAAGLFGPIVQDTEGEMVNAVGFHLMCWICIVALVLAMLTLFSDRRVLRNTTEASLQQSTSL